MNTQIERIKKTRKYLLDLLNDVPVEKLNKIPEGFNNNIVWNLGHMIASQQGICYIRAGEKPVVDERFFLQDKPGTKPETDVDENEVEQIKATLLSSLDQLETDYTKNLFLNYPSWSTRYGVEIASIDDALQFLMFHEGLHSGTIMAMKRLVFK